jgi:chemotaxis response regulator CheB
MRIAIANDMPLAVEALRRVLSANSSHKLAWVARDGVEAVQRCASDRPDLLLMDLLMPQLNGVEATRRIMDQSPCAVLVVTASVNHHAALVFAALNAGALDAARTPSLDPLGRPTNADSLMGKINQIDRLLGPVFAPTSPARSFRQRSSEMMATESAEHPLVVMGASAGGPAALANILRRLPPNFAAPILVVQHLASSFSPSLAGWLNAQTALDVRIAREGDRIVPGKVLLADGRDHLVLLNSLRIGYRKCLVRSDYEPSIDNLFSSAAQLWPGAIIGVLLTGMGRDGASGLLELKSAGHTTIVQSESTCAVYGMPRAAVELGAATRVLPLDRIAPCLANLAACKSI